jgi:hypothetical protein
MVLKFITAGVISAVLAGGAMYLAMDDEMLADLRADAQRSGFKDAVPELRRGAKTDDQGPNVMDRLLGRDAAERGADTSTNDDASANPSKIEQPATESADDDGAADLSSDIDTMPPTETPSRVGQRVEEPAPTRGWLDDFLPQRDTVATPIPVTGESVATGPVDAAVFDALLEQAALLEIDDARDDAYLNILNFALSEGRYDVAAELVDKLSAPPLRDTARQRIGISHAEAGRTDKAFSVLDDIEIKELADPIRLEIIRAVTSSRQVVGQFEIDP